jgi:toxin FitB
VIVLDTNVVSELTKPTPSPAVVAWLNDQPFDTLFITAITIAEMGFGIEILPSGKRRDMLQAGLQHTVELFADRVLPFDAKVAATYAGLAASARRAGKGFPTPDGYIAAIAASRGFAVATRDTAPFLAGGVEVIDPWDTEA